MNEKYLKYILIIILVIVFFSMIGTCSNRASTNSRFDILTLKLDSIQNENIKLQKLLNIQLIADLTNKIEASSAQFYLYKDEIDKKQITVEDLKIKLKKLQEINAKK